MATSALAQLLVKGGLVGLKTVGRSKGGEDEKLERSFEVNSDEVKL